MQRLHTENSDDVLIVKRNFPLVSIHANAEPAARAAEAAALQGLYEEMSDQLFDNQSDWANLSDPTATFESYAVAIGLDINQFRSDLNSAAVNQKLTGDEASVDALNLTGTPTLFLNGTLINTPGTFAELQTAVEQSAQSVASTTPGTISVVDNGDGTGVVNVDPPAGFSGDVRVRIAAQDTRIGNEYSGFTVIERAVGFGLNGTPTSSDASLDIDVDEVRTITFSGDDGDASLDQTITFAIETLPSNGSLTDFNAATGTATYTPNPGFEGVDTIEYSVSDDGGTGGGASDTSTLAAVTIDVGDTITENQQPTASAQTTEVDSGDSVQITLVGDDGDPGLTQDLQYQLVDGPFNGDLTNFDATNGTATYTPEPGFIGSDTFSFQVQDDGSINNVSDIAVVTINVNAAEDPNQPGTEPPEFVPTLRRGVLHVKGGDSDDAITVSVSGSSMEIVINGSASQTFSMDEVTALHIQCFTGDDVVNVSSAVTVPTEIQGGPGDDSLTGGAGDDSIRGGKGNDTIIGGVGNDILRGRFGDDLLLGGNDSDVIRGGAGNDRIEGQTGDDTLTGGIGNDSLIGGEGNDELHGASGNDVADASSGNDLVQLGKGNDTATGGSGRDRIRGGRHNDVLEGGDDDDTITGGPGSDVFVPDASDTFEDFSDKDRQETIDNLIAEILGTS